MALALWRVRPLRLQLSWLAEYAPEMIAVEARRYPSIASTGESIGSADVISVPIRLHCTDGFSEAYYGRPERLLEPGARLANSAWSFVEGAVETRFVERLREDIQSGAWDREFGGLRAQPHFDGLLRLVVRKPSGGE